MTPPSVTRGPVPKAWTHTTPEQAASWRYTAALQERSCDLVVVGGGLSGVAAAVAAARRRCRVLLIEDLHMLGGQASTSAVAAFDVTMHYSRALNEHGLWSEILYRLRAEYDDLGLVMNTARYRDDSLAANPVIIDRVLTALVQEEGISLLRRTRVDSAMASDTGVDLETARGPVHAAIVVDATEDGSLLSQVGAARRVGSRVVRSGEVPGTEVGHPFIQDITQVAVIRYHEEGLRADQRVPRPPGYRRLRPRIQESYPQDPSGNRTGDRGFAGYRGMPDLSPGASAYSGTRWDHVTRTSLNFVNDHPVRSTYLTDPRARARYERRAIERTMAVLFYLQSELRLPWALVDDEGFGAFPEDVRFPGWSRYRRELPLLPPRPYLRESVRGIGLDTLTGKDIYRRGNRTEARWNVDAIAVGTYPPDLHGGRTRTSLEADLGESLADKPPTWREGPFPVPAACLVSASHGRLLLAEKNISTSRIANGATRLHPTVTAIGEAVGALAALCVKHSLSPADVPPMALQSSLLRGGALIAPYALERIPRDHPDFATIGLAVARQAVPWTTLRRPNTEPVLATDPLVAARVGRALEDSVSRLVVTPRPPRHPRRP